MDWFREHLGFMTIPTRRRSREESATALPAWLNQVRQIVLQPRLCDKIQWLFVGLLWLDLFVWFSMVCLGFFGGGSFVFLAAVLVIVWAPFWFPWPVLNFQ